MKTIQFNIRKNTAKIALVGFLFAAGLSSCSDDFLVAEPELSISDMVIFTSPERAEAVCIVKVRRALWWSLFDI